MIQVRASALGPSVKDGSAYVISTVVSSIASADGAVPAALSASVSRILVKVKATSFAVKGVSSAQTAPARVVTVRTVPSSFQA